MRNKQPESTWQLNELHDLFMSELLQRVQEGTITEDEIATATHAAMTEALPEATQIWLKALRRQSAPMLREHRSMNRGFVNRNLKRWKRGFDALEMLIVASEEAGDAINNIMRPSAAQTNDYKFEALVGIHGRAVLVAREIYCLMQGGFADGALGRWKTLHELAIVASFLLKHDKEVSERYLLHRTVRSAKAAEQYKEYEVAAGLELFDDTELRLLVEARQEICDLHGAAMSEDWGWAATALSKQKRITFFDIEKDIGLDHWRPRYRWASQDTHGNFRPCASSLAMCESSDQLILVGPSNSGMIDPGQMVAHALVTATVPLLMLEPNLDRLATMKVLEALRNEVGGAFFAAEADSLEAERRKSTGICGLPRRAARWLWAFAAR